MNLNFVANYSVDGRHFNHGAGVTGANGYQNSRSCCAMRLIGKSPDTSFSQLETVEERRAYWRAIEFLRGNVSKFVG